VDILALKRRYKPERRLKRLAPRPESKLTPASLAQPSQIMFDTTVYIHEVEGRLPADAKNLIDRTLNFHSAFCLAEILAGISALDPSSLRYASVWRYYHSVFSGFPDNRILPPDNTVLAQAGVISGVLARTQNYRKEQVKELFNDAAIYLTAAKAGIPVLTANRGDFDLIQQAAGHGEFIHYTAT